MILADTSALYALLDRDDRNHVAAVAAWDTVSAETPLTHNYVVVETMALTQHRLGMGATEDLCRLVLPALRIEFIDPATHDAAMAALLAAGQRDVSLVDRVSFEVMRRLGIRRAFAFDADFADEGLELVPPT
ncbi:MAG: type II toxin-antitoxin system VapC family toxin [Nitriliruptorales bacterium]